MKVVIRLLILFVVTVLSYCGGAFVAASWNIAEWNSVAKGVLVLIWSCKMLGIIIFWIAEDRRIASIEERQSRR
ncbi:hypothetical protein D3C85_778980 [compost metagenome]